MNDRFNFLTLIAAVLLLSGTQAASGSSDHTGNLPISAEGATAYQYTIGKSSIPEVATVVDESIPQMISIFTGCNACEYQPVLSDNGNWRQVW